MAKRNIIKIDEDKCNGCGLCIPNCPEGALQIIDGKVRLISDLFCDGLGACIGHCPQGAITIEEREAEPYDEKKAAKKSGSLGSVSQLGHWPVQLRLVPPFAPFLNDADILVAADCVPFAYADFHENLLKGKVLLVGCPKFDDLALYKQKIEAILEHNNVKSITYARMEVPCCAGLGPVIEHAIAGSGKKIPYKEAVISVEGGRIS